MSVIHRLRNAQHAAIEINISPSQTSSSPARRPVNTNNDAIDRVGSGSASSNFLSCSGEIGTRSRCLQRLLHLFTLCVGSAVRSPLKPRSFAATTLPAYGPVPTRHGRAGIRTTGAQ